MNFLRLEVYNWNCTRQIVMAAPQCTSKSPTVYDYMQMRVNLAVSVIGVIRSDITYPDMQLRILTEIYDKNRSCKHCIHISGWEQDTKRLSKKKNTSAWTSLRIVLHVDKTEAGSSAFSILILRSRMFSTSTIGN